MRLLVFDMGLSAGHQSARGTHDHGQAAEAHSAANLKGTLERFRVTV